MLSLFRLLRAFLLHVIKRNHALLHWVKLRTSLGLVAGAPPARARGAATMTEEPKKDDGEGLQSMELLSCWQEAR